MIKRTVEISRAAAHLSVRHSQLTVRRDGQTIGSIPCEDIATVVVDHPQVTYTHGALASLAESGATVVVCGRNHLPAAMVLPLSDHSQVVWRIHEQLAVGAPLKKQLWKQLIQAKIRAQAANLPEDSASHKKLHALAKLVRSGDPANVEARAARVYWAHWLPDQPFRRDPELQGINSMLNYGYAVVRASIARALVASGLLPAIGLHHCNRSNAFCLADDLVEPIRPMVDEQVRKLHLLGYTDLCPETKAFLLEILAAKVRTGDGTGPLMVGLQLMVGSLTRCYRKEAKGLEIPVAC
ncbi:MAG: type II CRISPR-associated endonuclease Cas1 [Pirellulales bacterium]|nr:type II CRISPR-associated endonuclease Cas1 [Pirellulales bacterium]